jgi:hypothetical protein
MYVVFVHIYANTFLVDEWKLKVTDVQSPDLISAGRFLTISERTTIRVVMDESNVSDLEAFISWYSECSVVHQIQVMWDFQEEDPPSSGPGGRSHSASASKSAKSSTSRRDSPKAELSVVYDTSASSRSLSYASKLEVETESVTTLDSDVRVSCESLYFTQTVWMSSRETMGVGFFPRAHSIQTIADERLGPSESAPLFGRDGTFERYRYLGAYNVWWNHAYSLMLSSGAIIHKKFLQDLTNPPPGVKNKLSEFRLFEKVNAQCSQYLGLPLWNAFRGASLPIWVDVPVSYSHISSAQIYNAEDFSDLERTNCLNKLIQLFDISHLDYTTYKATMARSSWIW